MNVWLILSASVVLWVIAACLLGPVIGSYLGRRDGGKACE